MQCKLVGRSALVRRERITARPSCSESARRSRAMLWRKSAGLHETWSGRSGETGMPIDTTRLVSGDAVSRYEVSERQPLFSIEPRHPRFADRRVIIGRVADRDAR